MKSPNKEMDDIQIIQGILYSKQQSDKRKFQGLLYDRYSTRVYNRCLILVKNQETALDLAHDIFIKIFLKLHGYSQQAPFGAWVNSIIYNHCISYLNQTKKHKSLHVNLLTDDLRNIQNPVESESQEYILVQLEKALEQIPEVDKMIMMMRYYDDLSVKQIAGHLQIGESAVKMRLKRCRDHLAKNLKHENEK